MSKSIYKLTAALLVFLILAAGSLSAKEASSIRLIDGTVYSNVSFKTDDHFRVIYVTVDDEEKTISYTKILEILDANGENITESVTGKRSVRPEKPRGEAVSGESEVEAAPDSDKDWLNPQEQKVKYGKLPFGASLNFHTCMSFPVGDYYDGIDAGVGFGANLVVPVGRGLALRGTVSKSGLGLDFADLSVWRFLFGFQYYNWPKWRDGGKTIFSFWTGLGAASHTAAYGFSETKFATNGGGSIIMMLSDVVGAEIGTNLDVVWVGSAKNYDGTSDLQTALIFDVRLGLAFML